MTHLKGLRASNKLIDKRVVNGCMHDQPRRGGTFLTRATKRAAKGQRDRQIQIRIIHHRERVFTAHLHLNLGQITNRRSRNALAYRDRSGKGNCVQMRAFHQMLTNRTTRTHHQIEQPLGNILTRDNLSQRHGRGRGQIGRFPDHRIAKGQRRGDFPACRGSGEIPRRDNRNNAHRFTAHVNLNTIARRIGCLTHLTQHLGSVIGEELTRAINLPLAFRQRLALFAR